MQNTVTINYKPQEKYIVVNGKKYSVAIRTPKIEEELKVWNADRFNNTDLHNYISIFDILLGESARMEIIGDEEQCDLDYLNFILLETHKMYIQEKENQEMKRMQREIEKIKPITETTKQLSESAQYIKSMTSDTI